MYGCTPHTLHRTHLTPLQRRPPQRFLTQALRARGPCLVVRLLCALAVAADALLGVGGTSLSKLLVVVRVRLEHQLVEGDERAAQVGAAQQRAHLLCAEHRGGGGGVGQRAVRVEARRLGQEGLVQRGVGVALVLSRRASTAGGSASCLASLSVSSTPMTPASVSSWYASSPARTIDQYVAGKSTACARGRCAARFIGARGK